MKLYALIVIKPGRFKMIEPLLVIPTYIRNKTHGELLFRCLKTLRVTTDAPVLVVDDGSPHTEQVDILQEHFEKTFDGIEFVRKEENEGFSKTVNVGLKRALENDQDAVLVNADIEFDEESWLLEMLNDRADIVGARLLYPNRTIQHAGIYFSPITRGFDHRFQGAPENLPDALVYCNCPVTGALQFLSNDVLNSIGLYDEEFRLGYEDVDYMIRAIQAGFKSAYNPLVRAIHHESAFRKNSIDEHKVWQRQSAMRLRQKNKDVDFINIAPTMTEKTYEQNNI